MIQEWKQFSISMKTLAVSAVLAQVAVVFLWLSGSGTVGEGAWPTLLQLYVPVAAIILSLNSPHRNRERSQRKHEAGNETQQAV
jgi:hypothetical protein